MRTTHRFAALLCVVLVAASVTADAATRPPQPRPAPRPQLRGPLSASSGRLTSPPTPLPAAALTWMSIGPKPITSPFGFLDAPWTGRVSAIANDPGPGASDTAYVGGASGGVWKTTDAGAHWTPIFDGQDSLAIGSLAVSPASSMVVIAGTGEANFSQDSYYGEGIFRTADGGTTWSKSTTTPSVDGCDVSDVVFKPLDASVVYAAVVDPGMSSSPGGGPGCSGAGIFRSADGGVTFTQVKTGSWDDLAADPSDGTKWYGAEFGVGVFKFSDTTGFGSFTQFITGLPTAIGRAAVAVAPSDSTRLYAGFVSASGSNFDGIDGGIWTSSDTGTHWSQITDQSWYPSASFPWYALQLVVDPSTATTIYVVTAPPLVKLTGIGTAGIADSSPGSSAMHSDFHAMTFDSTGRAWIGNDGGVYQTSDFTHFANLNSTLSLTQFEPGGTLSNDGHVFGGTQDNGDLLFDGSSLSWPSVGPPCDGGWGAINPSNPFDIVMTPQGDDSCGGVVFKTTSPGSSFPTEADSGINQSESALFYAPLVESLIDPNFLYYGRTHLYISTNRAGSWSKYSNHQFPAFQGISAIGASSTTNTVYVGLDTGSIQSTTNHGSNWTPGSGLPSNYVTDITVDPADPATAYATESGFLAGHVFKTIDSGAHWTDLSPATFDSPANGIAVDWRTSPRTLYVATDNGVLVSIDDGANWKDATGNQPHAIDMNVLIDTLASPNKLIVMTQGRGVFTAPLSAVIDTTLPDTIITKAPPNRTENRTATFRFGSTKPGSTFGCKLDGEPSFVTCLPGASFSHLKLGKHTFQVVATDPLFHMDPTPATKTWTILR